MGTDSEVSRTLRLASGWPVRDQVSHLLSQQAVPKHMKEGCLWNYTGSQVTAPAHGALEAAPSVLPLPGCNV